MDVEHNVLMDAVAAINARFSSGNSVPVDRAWVPEAEWKALQFAMALALTPPEGSDQGLLELAATFETCIPFLPSAGQRNIGKAVAQLRHMAMGYVLVPVEPTEAMLDAGRAAVMAEHCAGPKWTPRQHFEASGRSTAGIPEDVLDERGPLTKESTASMVFGSMLAARPEVPDGRG